MLLEKMLQSQGFGTRKNCQQLIQNAAIKIQDDSGNFASCYSIPNAQVYSGKLMQIELKNDFTLTMPFLGTFVGGQVIPIDVQSTGMVLRPPPP